MKKTTILTLAVMLVVACLLGTPALSETAWAAGQKNCWSSDGMSFYGSDGKKVTGIVVIKETSEDGAETNTFYAFTKKGKLAGKKTLALWKAAKYEKNFSALKKLIGKPVSKTYSYGCYAGPVKNGKTPYEGGKDGSLKYKTYTVASYLAPDGTEFYLGVTGKKYHTKLTDTNHSANVKKVAKAQGAKSRTIKEIKGKKYCYDGNGKQHVGWQKVGSNYYYFKMAKGSKGYMVKGKTVNHIKLGKDGKAKVTDKNREQIKTLVKTTDTIK